MSASSLSLPIFLRINFLISYLDSNRLTEHIRLTHTESFAEWQKAGAGRTSRAFKHPGHDVTAPDVWPSILTDYTYDSELDNADGVPLVFRRSSMFPEGNWASIPPKQCHKLITSIPRRIKAVIKAKWAQVLVYTQVSQFELNYWNKWTFPRHSNLLRCTCITLMTMIILIHIE